jgi:acyl-CoA thioester hydrolase
VWANRRHDAQSRFGRPDFPHRRFGGDTTARRLTVHVHGAAHVERRRVDVYPLTDFAQARYSDMDVNGHLNNLALEGLHENARAHLNRAVFADIYEVDNRDLRLLTSQNVTHFLAEAHWPAIVTTGIGIGGIGRSSLVASSGLFIDGSCISICDATLVLVGRSGPVAIPDVNRQVLEGLLLQGSAG